MAVKTRSIGLTWLGLIALAGCSYEPQGEARRLTQEVCLAYDDLRGRDVIKLENNAEIQQIHSRAMEVCDLVDDGRAAAEELGHV
jgi:hypothetical protein